jgi:hypothetical protein
MIGALEEDQSSGDLAGRDFPMVPPEPRLATGQLKPPRRQGNQQLPLLGIGRPLREREAFRGALAVINFSHRVHLGAQGRPDALSGKGARPPYGELPRLGCARLAAQRRSRPKKMASTGEEVTGEATEVTAERLYRFGRLGPLGGCTPPRGKINLLRDQRQVILAFGGGLRRSSVTMTRSSQSSSSPVRSQWRRHRRLSDCRSPLAAHGSQR